MSYGLGTLRTGKADIYDCLDKPSCCMQAFTEKSMEFQTKIIERSGLGNETYLPDGRLAAGTCASQPKR